MKRLGVMSMIALIALTMLSACVIVPVGGWHGGGWHNRPYYGGPYPYHHRW